MQGLLIEICIISNFEYRRVLLSLDWGPAANGTLALGADVHLVCAEAVVKGHLTQCKTQNGLIAKSVSKVGCLIFCNLNITDGHACISCT